MVSCIPARALAGAVAQSDGTLASALAEIPFLDFAVVNVRFAGQQVLPLDGFGYLVPTWEPSGVLGVVFDSCAFPQLNTAAAGAETRLTVMLGGYQGPLPGEGEAVERALQALRDELGITVAPSDILYYPWPRAMPQYEVGHVARVARLRRRVREGPFDDRVSLAGNSYDGVGVNDCVVHAEQAADRVLGQLQL